MEVINYSNGQPRTLDLETSATFHHGYGSYSKYIDCNSALGLIGFLIFLDILRDLIQTVTSTTPTGRRKRNVDSHHPFDAIPEVASFVANDGFWLLAETLQNSINSLNEDGEEYCHEMRLCEINAELSKRHGVAGRVIGTLLSNLIGPMGATTEENLSAYFQAAKIGRTKLQCSTDYLLCNKTNVVPLTPFA